MKFERVITTCDMCQAMSGIEVDGARPFVLGGGPGRIHLDLCQEHRDELEEAIAPYVELTRQLTAPPERRRRGQSAFGA